MNSDGHAASCSYCGLFSLRCWAIDTLAGKVETAFQQHFERTSDQPNSYQDMLLRDKEYSYDWYRSGEPIGDAIEFSAQVPSERARDIVQILAERHDDWDSAMQGEETDFSAEGRRLE